MPGNAKSPPIATAIAPHLSAADCRQSRAAAAQARIMFQHAVKIGVSIAMGTDAGVEPHGLNAREFSLMTENGMTPAQAVLASTAGAPTCSESQTKPEPCNRKNPPTSSLSPATPSPTSKPPNTPSSS